MTLLPRPSRTAWRDTVLFLAGLGLTIYEATVHEGAERWGLIILYAAMMGLPLVLRGDEQAASPQAPPPPPPPVSSGPPAPTGGALP